MIPKLLWYNDRKKLEKKLKEIIQKQPEIEISAQEEGIITINKIRQLKKEVVLLKSLSPTILIQDFDLANLEAQNASLKLLEEASTYTNFVLTTQNINAILPTVLSRCQIIDVRDKSLKSKELISNLRFKDIEVKNKEELLNLIDNLTLNLHLQAKKGKTEYIKILHTLLKLRNLALNNNLHPQLTADFILILLKKSNTIK